MNAVIQANTLGVHFNQFLYPDVIAGGGPMAVWYRVHAPVITNNFGPFTLHTEYYKQSSDNTPLINSIWSIQTLLVYRETRQI